MLGKASVAPLKQHTITKLELQAAVFGKRFANFVKRESTSPITQTFFCSDITTAIQRIRNSPKRQQIFMTNRVSEILETTTVTGDINPAEDATRGILIAHLTETRRWFTGPSFLRKTPENWPAEILLTSSEPSPYPTNQSMLFPSARNSHKQSTSPSISQKFLLGSALYVTPVSFTAPLAFSVIPSKTLNIVPYCRRTSQLSKSQTQRPNFCSFPKRKVFSRKSPPSSPNNHSQATAASKH